MGKQSIQILGSGCPTCAQLHELVKQITSKLNIQVKIEYITDINKLIESGIMGSPALVINGKPVLVGGYNSDLVEEELKKLF